VWTLGLGAHTWYNWPRPAAGAAAYRSTVTIAQPRRQPAGTTRITLMLWLLPSIGLYATGVATEWMYREPDPDDE
jgi:hypothetical protein